MAQFLCTKSEPKLVSQAFAFIYPALTQEQYYKPWELLPGDAERIKAQVADTEALIQREIQDFNRLHKTESQSEERPREDARKEEETAETEGEHHAESSPVPHVDESDTTNPLLPTVKAQAPESGQVHNVAEKDSLEENGEVVVEGDEDTVIY